MQNISVALLYGASQVLLPLNLVQLLLQQSPLLLQEAPSEEQPVGGVGGVGLGGVGLGGVGPLLPGQSANWHTLLPPPQEVPSTRQLLPSEGAPSAQICESVFALFEQIYWEMVATGAGVGLGVGWLVGAGVIGAGWK